MSTELGSMALERLEQEIGELAAHIHAATCRWLLLVAEFDRREGWANWGAKSCGQWLSWRCGVAPRAAREQVRVARRLLELPLVCDAFGRGELSYSKVRAISGVASPNTESQLVMLAQHATAAQLERLVRGYRGVVSTQVEQANRTHAERYVDWEWNEDGSLSLRARRRKTAPWSSRRSTRHGTGCGNRRPAMASRRAVPRNPRAPMSQITRRRPKWESAPRRARRCAPVDGRDAARPRPLAARRR